MSSVVMSASWTILNPDGMTPATSMRAPSTEIDGPTLSAAPPCARIQYP